jgi:hypothetical protein
MKCESLESSVASGCEFVLREVRKVSWRQVLHLEHLADFGSDIFWMTVIRPDSNNLHFFWMDSQKNIVFKRRLSGMPLTRRHCDEGSTNAEGRTHSRSLPGHKLSSLMSPDRFTIVNPVYIGLRRCKPAILLFDRMAIDSQKWNDSSFNSWSDEIFHGFPPSAVYFSYFTHSKYLVQPLNNEGNNLIPIFGTWNLHLFLFKWPLCMIEFRWPFVVLSGHVNHAIPVNRRLNLSLKNHPSVIHSNVFPSTI